MEARRVSLPCVFVKVLIRKKKEKKMLWTMLCGEDYFWLEWETYVKIKDEQTVRMRIFKAARKVTLIFNESELKNGIKGTLCSV